MRRSWTLGQQLMLGFALPVLVLIVLGSFAYWTSRQQIETAERVAFAHTVVEEVGDVLVVLEDAETGERGFLLTGQEELLSPYQTATARIQSDIEDVRRVVADQPEQQRRLAVLEPLIRDALGDMAAAIDVRRREGLEAAERIASAGRINRAMDGIRKTIAEMDDDARALVARRTDEAGQASSRLATVLVGGSGLTILFVLALGAAIIRGVERRIGGTVQQMLSAAAEMQAAATQQAKGAKGQVSASTEVATTMRELVTTSRQIADSAQRVTGLAGDTSAAARSGDETVEDARRAIERVKQQVDRIVHHMLDLGRRSQDIGGILDVINELSEQTNILAINATIEAAGAGDSGRRFAVVADEIRKLADRVGGSTKDIRALVEEIRAAANTTVMATEDGAKVADACIEQFGAMAGSLRGITDAVMSTTQASREIELSTRQQTTAVEQVSAAIADVAQTAHETDTSAGQVQMTAAQLTDLAKQLAAMVRQDAAV